MLLYRSTVGRIFNFVLADLVARTYAVPPVALHGRGAITLVTLGRWAVNIIWARPPQLPVWRRPSLSVWRRRVHWAAPDGFISRRGSCAAAARHDLVGMNAGAARSLASVPASYRIVIVTHRPLLGRFSPETGASTLA